MDELDAALKRALLEEEAARNFAVSKCDGLYSQGSCVAAHSRIWRVLMSTAIISCVYTGTHALRE